MDEKEIVKKYLKELIEKQLKISDLLKDKEYFDKNLKEEIKSDLLDIELRVLYLKSNFSKKVLKEIIKWIDIKEITHLNHPINLVLRNWVHFIIKYFSNDLNRLKCDFKKSIGLNLALMLLEICNYLDFDYKIMQKTYFYLSVVNWYLWNQRKKEYWALKINSRIKKRQDFLLVAIKYFLLKDVKKLKNNKFLKAIEDEILKDEILNLRKETDFKDWEFEIIKVKNILIDLLEFKEKKVSLIEELKESKLVFIENGNSYLLHLVSYLLTYIEKKDNQTLIEIDD